MTEVLNDTKKQLLKKAMHGIIMFFEIVLKGSENSIYIDHDLQQFTVTKILSKPAKFFI